MLALSLVAASGFAVANPSKVGAIMDSVVTTSQNADEHRVTICHDVEGNGNTGNGYNIETVDKDSIASNPNGHDTHEARSHPTVRCRVHASARRPSSGTPIRARATTR